MRVIFITDSYYPSPSPNAICVKKLKDVFDEKEITTDIIAVRTFSKNTKLLRDNSIHFVNPDFLFSALIEAKAANNLKRFSFISKLFKIRGAVYGLFWPLISLSNIIKYTNAIGKLINKSKEEIIVVGVYKSLEGAVSGAIVKRIWKRGTYVLYTLDAVSGGIIPRVLKSQYISNKSIKRWERFLFKAYDLLFVMQSHKNYYDSNEYSLFRNKIHYVDIPLFSMRTVKENILNEGKIHFVFTGGISKKTANPLYFLQILDYLHDERFVFDVYGKIYNRDIEEKLISSKYTKYHGVFSHEEVLEIQSCSNCLLNFGNYTPCAIPCKIFEYFSTGKPIISFIKIDDDASLPYITKYPNSLIIDERLSIEINALSLTRYVDALSSTSVEDLQSIFFENTPEATVDRILACKNGE